MMFMMEIVLMMVFDSSNTATAEFIHVHRLEPMLEIAVSAMHVPVR